MNKTGLMFGSFNPVHIGHLALANYVLSYSDLQEIWFVVTPQNPFKESINLAPENHRLKMMEVAINNDERFKICDIEFNMPRPSYTIDTLDKLKELYPDKLFSLIMGADNLLAIDKWKEPARLMASYHIICYPRNGSDLSPTKGLSNVEIINAPLMDISATLIRNALKKQKNIRFLLPHGVYDYIKKNNLYG